MGIIEGKTEDYRKEQIIRCVKLGMDLQSAMYTVACNDQEMETLEKDEEFMRRVDITKSILEMNLIERHDSAMDIQLAQGKTGAVQWKLERINPSKWGKVPGELNSNAPAVLIVEIPGLNNPLNQEDHIGNALPKEDSETLEDEDANN